MNPPPSPEVRTRAYVGVGSNLNDPARHVREAMAALEQLPSTAVAARASLYRSAPVGRIDQPDFVNSVAALDTALAPQELLDRLLAIEARHGRVRGERNAPRTLDLDLLLYGEQRVQGPALTLPHPRMHERAFVLLPLAELDAGARVPGHGCVRDLLDAVAGQRVTRMQEP
ncbi:MAG: 2-amino-4-hydroxy-6-hydroxymethyldihydropteridine diphosphokinase [Burkholderiales bacterium]|nr:2-amino-4-hydroxy-6-hydroxymethyldihydropteridine diphosphokinase [Burkholderiales bacterium]